MQFDVAGAKREGYSEAEIAGFLASRSRFDIDGARKEGYEDKDIIAYLMAGKGGAEPAPTEQEIEGASRPAQMTLTRGGKPVLQPNAPLPEDEPAADWGGVAESLPAQLVAGAESSAANLKEMMLREGISARRKGIEADVKVGTPLRLAQAEHRRRMLERAEKELETAVPAAAKAREIAASVTPENMTVAQQALSSLAQSSPSTLVGVSAGILTRNLPLAFAIAGGGGAAQQAGATYGEARERGATHEKATMAAMIDAALEGGGEMLPLGFALKAGTPIFKRVFGTIAREAGQESATQLAQDLRSMAMENPNLTFAEVWRNLKVAALAGAGGGVVYGGAGGAANWARDREAQKVIDADTARTVDRIAKAGSVDEAITEANAALEADDARAGTRAAVAEAQASVDMPEVTGTPAEAEAGPIEQVPAPEQAQAEQGAGPTAMQAAMERALEGSRQRERAPAGSGESAAPSEGAPQAQAVAPEVEPAQAEFLGKPVSEHTVLQLRVAARYSSDSAIRRAAREELSRRSVGALEAEAAAKEAAATTAEEQSKVDQPQPAHSEATEVRIFGKPLEQLTDKELAVSARAHRMSGFREAARVELERRNASVSERPGATQATAGAQTPSVAVARQEGAPAQAVRQDQPTSESRAARPLILGRPAEQHTSAMLRASLRGGSPAVREIAQAELARRGEPPTVARGSTAPPGLPQREIAGKAQAAEASIPPIVPPATTQERAVEQPESRELPAVGIVLTPPYVGPGGTEATDAMEGSRVRHARPDAIRQAIRDMFRVPINEGGFKGSRDKLGIYKVKPQTIRVRNQNDVAVITHELGHHISETSREVREARKAFDAELRNITPYAVQQKSVAAQREEGMAEFVRLYLTEPTHAAERASGFFTAFDDYVAAHGMKPALYEIGSRIWDWQRLPPADRILAKVGEAEPEFRKRWNLDRIIFEVFDRWLPMKRMVADLKPEIAPSADPFKLAHLLSGDSAIIEDWLLRETIPFDFARRANVKDRGKPLAEILQPVQDQQREFGAYLIARRANELMQRGKEHLYSKDEIAAGLRLETPEFKAAAEEIYRYQDGLLQYGVEGGLLSEHVADKFRQFPYYVPFFRVGEPIGQRGDIFKAIRGGTENLRDPISNIIENTVRVIHATNRNAVLAKAHALARSVPGGGRWIEDVPMPERAVKLETQKIIDQLREQGIQVDTGTAEAIANTQTFFVKNPFGDDRDRIIVVREGGKPKAVQINDDMLWHALERFDPVDMGLVEKVLSVPADILRAGIVLSPDFMARNFARDTLSGFIQSKKGIVPVIGTLDGFKEVATRSDVARLYRAFGGAFGDMWRADRGFERRLVERMARRGGFDARTILTPRGLISLLHRIGSVTEAGTRVAEFKRTAKEGDIDSLIEAAYNAREVSVDFGMHGHSRTIRFLTRVTVFMNPALQGYYKAVRTGKTQPMTTLLRGALLAAASIGLFLKNRDDEWYDEIEQWERNVYWHLDIGLRDPQGQVIPLRIPKPFEWGGIFGSIPEALAEVSIKQHGKEFAKRLTSIMDDVFTFRVIPSALVVPAELWANKNQFTGRPIVPESKERLAPELQATPGASLTARKAGELTDTSPAKIDHAVRGLFGTLGTYTVMLADQALRLGGAEPQALPIPWARYPVAKAFFRDPSGANSRYVTEFYELLKEARRAEASVKYMDQERMTAYYEKNREAIEHRRSAEKVSRWMARLRRENEEIRKDHDAPDSQRMQMIAENNRQIRWLGRDFMKDVQRQKGVSP